jgi:hypothetical protein
MWGTGYRQLYNQLPANSVAVGYGGRGASVTVQSLQFTPDSGHIAAPCRAIS